MAGDLKAEDYFNLHYAEAHGECDDHKLFNLLARAHYLCRQEGLPYRPDLADMGADLFELDRQKKNPN